MRAAVALLAFASSAFAYTVTFPGQNQPWGDSGSNKLTWTKVSTDKQNFTVVLDNQSIPGFTPQVLAALVDGSSGATTLNPPNPGWQDGSNYRINLVQDENNLSTIYAQSTQFDIKPSNSSSSTTSKKPSTSTSTGTSTATTSDDSTPTDTQNVPPSSAAIANSVSTGALALFAVMAYALA